MIICAIETSCDETSVAIVKNGKEVLSNVIYSQIDIHKRYGGVVPEIAARKHIEKLNIVFKEALETASITIEMIDKFAVTYGPGLIGALLTGVSFAKALAYYENKPLIGVNHMHGHIYSNFISHPRLEPPFICLVVSGGHTHIVDFKGHDSMKVIGKTRDDASGEAFDKIARALGIGYPGGPVVDKLSKNGDEERFVFPAAGFSDNEFDFSFSGPKTAVINLIHKMKSRGEPIPVEDVCASFQKSICDVLINKTINACRHTGYDLMCVAGGVSANSYLRKEMPVKAYEHGIKVFFPSIEYCTDNAAMIAARAYYIKEDPGYYLELNAVANLKID